MRRLYAPWWARRWDARARKWHELSVESSLAPAEIGCLRWEAWDRAVYCERRARAWRRRAEIR